MKTILAILALSAVGCSGGSKSPFVRVSAGTLFSDEVRTSGGVESSLVAVDGTMNYLYDPFMNGTLDHAVLSSPGEIVSERKVSSGKRFSYVFQHDGEFYMFAESDNAIYAWSSADLDDWSPMNGGEPVLHPSTGLTANLWNVGVDVDDSGVWHMFVEASSGDDSRAGIAHLTATMDGDSLSFDASNPTVFTIPEAGNPFVKYVPGKGFLMVYGSQQGPYWTVAAATSVDGKDWTVSNFSMGAHGVHVCDPTMEYLDGLLYLAVSVGQVEVHTMSVAMTFPQFFDYVRSL